MFGFLNNKRFRISPGLFFDAIFVLSNILFMSEKEKWRKLNMAEKESAVDTAHEKIKRIFNRYLSECIEAVEKKGETDNE